MSLNINSGAANFIVKTAQNGIDFDDWTGNGSRSRPEKSDNVLKYNHPNEILCAVRNLTRAALLSGVVVGGLAPPALATERKTDTYLVVWASDKETDDNHLDPDFLAIIDADPRSPDYGKVVNTAALESVPNANLLDELGLASGVASDFLNEAHHMNHDPIIVYGRQYLFPAGLMSANIFRCDVTDPLHIPTCPLVTTSTQVKKFAGIDDIVQLPNGNLLITYLGAKDLTTPGGLVEIDVEGNVIGEYDAAQPGGRYGTSPVSKV